LADLGNLIDAMGDYRAVAILTGGFVPLMYRRMPEYVTPPMPPLLTSDFDWTVPTRLELMGDQSLAERLLDSKFVTIPSAGTEPPVLRFQPERFGTTTLGPTYVEFLAPLVGPDVDRKGNPKTVVRVQRGLTAQALRYLDLLFVEPMSFDAATLPELGLAQPTNILLPSPASYVIQKLLAWPSRDAGKRGKDLAYVHEVAVLTQKRWPEFAATVGRLRARFPTAWFDRVSDLIERQFESEAAEGPVAVVRQYRDLPGRVPSERAVWQTVRDFARVTGIAQAEPER
jgi:hypothetical protein